ncbi:D-3-phosphoglycerate dehydrogenase [plant metagenome]|uniref:D-3-phosphoglycerate dehydrogenase n=1 Tax=plant metagenome TaxID=1297885 RepID=A0A484SN93_9ZZZZ
MKPTLFIRTLVSEAHRARIAEHFDVLYATSAEDIARTLAESGPRIRAVLTTGLMGLTAAQIDAMPKLEVVCALGVGYENIDVAHARQRGIVLANGAGTNDACVADHAFALLLATVRNVLPLDRHTRDGGWRATVAMPPGLTGKRLGILGLGAIGRQIARRATAFDMEVGYHSRRARDDAAYPYFSDILSLAQWSDILVLAAPGGPATHHMVDAQVLDALGPQGYVINVARGSVIDTEALASALRERRIAGAGLDVYESEPDAPETLLGFDTLVLTPHVGGWSPEAVNNSVQRFLDNTLGHFAGRGVVSAIPE